MTKKFHLVLGLHISPDFSEAEAGRAPPPRADHDKVEKAVALARASVFKRYLPYFFYDERLRNIDSIVSRERAETIVADVA